MSEVDLATLADAGAFVSHEHQAHLADAVRIGDWRVDPAGAALVFTDGEGAERTVRAHLIGTSSPDDGTWLWGWANPSGFPAAFVRRGEQVRALGERYAIPEFTTATLPLDTAAPRTLVDAVKAVTGITAHFRAPTGTGSTRAWLLLEDPALALPAPTLARAVAVVTSALAGGGAVDHRRALTAWTEQRGVGLAHLDDDVDELTLSDGSLQVRFDASGRIAGLGRRLRRATPRPAPAEAEAERDAPPALHDRVAPAPAPAPVPVPSTPLAPVAVAPRPTGPGPRRRGFLDRLLGR